MADPANKTTILYGRRSGRTLASKRALQQRMATMKPGDKLAVFSAGEVMTISRTEDQVQSATMLEIANG